MKGDRVRITVGKPKDKFNNGEEGVKSGYKVYTVVDVNQAKSRVFLEGLTVRPWYCIADEGRTRGPTPRDRCQTTLTR